jgi:hypothetical protein
VNYNPDKSDKNVVLSHDERLDYFNSYRGYIEDYYIRNDLHGRFNLDTNDDRNATKVLSSFVFSGSRDFISSFNDRNEIIDYYRECNEFLKTEYPEYHVVDSRVHFDEKGLPHCHTSVILLHTKENGDKCINVTQNQKGKDYFRGFQDRFFEYMKDKYPDRNLQRTDPNRDHDKKMQVKEYKEFKDFQRTCKTRLEKMIELEKEINLKDKELTSYRDYLDKVDDYCNRNGITHYQYEKQCFYADRGVGDYPPIEKFNPERVLIVEKEEPKKEIERER